MFNLLYCRSLKLVSIALNHDSLLVQSVFKFSISRVLTSLTIIFCMVFVMSNNSDYEVSCSKIVCEFRTTCIPGFDQSEQNVFVDHISTY